LVRLLDATDLKNTLASHGPFTLFAPNDDAFKKVSNDTLNDLLKPENKGKLTDILDYHLLSGSYTQASIKTMALPIQLETLSTEKFIADKSGDSVKINSAIVTTADIFATNGIIQSIDTFLMPTTDIIQTETDSGNFKTFINALTTVGLLPILKSSDPYTVFAPTDAAFAKLQEGVVEELLKPENKNTLTKILDYHIKSGIYTVPSIDRLALPLNITMYSGDVATLNENGNVITINSVSLSQSDVFSSNGITHSIDQILLPPLDIIEMVLTKGNFKNLTAGLKAANLTATLKSTGPFTLFAPTDTAFAKLPEGTFDDLLKPENKEKLTNILRYHVLPERKTNAEFKEMTLPAQLTTLSSLKCIVDLSLDSVKVNNGIVTQADVNGTNGIIHVIDTVLLPPTDIVETLIHNGSFTMFNQAINTSGLNETLRSSGPFTVFTSNDDAFNKLPAGVFNELMKPENQGTLSKIIQHHATDQLITSSSITRMSLPANINMLSGGTARINQNGNIIKVDNANIVMTDIYNTNGMIHVIDSVLLPPLDVVETVIIRGKFQTFIRALKAADLFDTLKDSGTYTIFAPTDDAFDRLSPEVLDDLFKPENKHKLINTLKYHLLNTKETAADIQRLTLPVQLNTLSNIKIIADLNGNLLKINTATVTEADVSCTNGIIHIIDDVLLLPTDIIQTVVDDGNFKTLVNELITAGLTDALKGTGPFTLFAPTDEAFNRLPSDFLSELNKPENKKLLAKILQYHVTNQIITVPTLNRMALPNSITMLAGGTATLNKVGTQIKINNSTISATDIFNTNGIIHIIDTVILPPRDIFEIIVADGNFDTLELLLRTADLVDTIQGNGPFTFFATNDDAFAKLSNGSIDDLLKPEKRSKLIDQLKYHIVNGRKITSDQFTSSEKLTMLNGKTVDITKNGDDIKVNDIKIITKNVTASNGIIHIIEGFLTPSETSSTSLHAGQTHLILFALIFVYVIHFFA